MYYNLHTHFGIDRSDVTAIVNRYPYEPLDIPFFSSGIHPWYIDVRKADENLDIIEQRLGMGNCLAVGECGLDKRIDIPFEIQIEIFERQLLLAKKYQKPVILHLVGAFEELIALRKKVQPGVPMILHGFSKNGQLAKQLLDNGFYLSFGKYLLRNPELSDVLKQVPADRFFLETDTIEEGIEEVYEKGAKALGITVEELKTIISTNFKSIFLHG